MKVTGPIKMLSLKEKTFKDEKRNQDITFTQAEFCDDEGNKFSCTVPTDCKEFVKFDEKKPDVIATLEISNAITKTGGNYNKINLIATK